jgi:hypothetical protein
MAVTSRRRPIVVGVDGSAGSAAATTALDDLRMALQPQMPALPVQAVVRRGPADLVLLQPSLVSVPITLQVTDQDPVDGLVTAAPTAELLVVGRRAPDGSRQVGSTGLVVTARAGPVLVVPVPAEQPSLDREWARRHAGALAR